MEYQQQQNMNQQFSQYGNVQPQQEYYSTNRPKNRGLNLFQIPIFEIYNPKNATVVFQVDTKTNELGIMMAPAIPGNPAINARGPVQKGINVYDYSKKVVSNFTDVEIIDFIYFLKSKFLKTTLEGTLNAINQNLEEIKSSLSTVQSNSNVLNEINFRLSDIQNQLAKQSNNQNDQSNNQFGLYRKKSGMEDRAWNFVYDPGYNMLHINVISGSNKIKTSLSSKMVLRLLSILESYTSNYACMSAISEIAHSLSRTLALHNMIAPSKEQIKELD